MTDNIDYLRIGVITGTHALKGRLKVFVITDNLNRFTVGNNIKININQEYKEFTIQEFSLYKSKKKIAFLKLDGIDDIDTAEKLKKKEIFITKTEAEEKKDELEENYFYYYDIIDCDVYLNGEKFSKVVEIIEAGSGEVLVIENDNKKIYMIPFVESIVDTKNISEKRIDIYPVEGLLD